MADNYGRAALDLAYKNENTIDDTVSAVFNLPIDGDVGEVASLSPENAKTLTAAIGAGSVKVTFWGDSITQGTDYVDISATYVNLYMETMRSYFPSVTFTPTNLGIAARKLEDAANPLYVSPTNFSLNWSTTPDKPWREYVRDTNPDLLFIAFGMNGTSTTVESTKANLDSIMTYIGTWSKKPTVVLITNFTPKLGYVEQPEIDKRNAIARSTRAYAKLKGLGLIDVNKVYRILRYGKNDAIGIAEKIRGFDGWQHDNGVTGDSSTRAYTGGKYSKRQAPVNFKVRARFSVVAGNVLGFKFRNTGIVFFNTNDKNIKIYKALGSSNVIAQKNDVTLTVGNHYLSLLVCENKAVVYLDDVEVLSTTDVFFDFSDNLVQVGYEIGGGTIDNVEITEFNSRSVTPMLTDEDIVGKYILGDYTIKYPYGGNGVNHPTSGGLLNLYYRGIVQLADIIKTRNLERIVDGITSGT